MVTPRYKLYSIESDLNNNTTDGWKVWHKKPSMVQLFGAITFVYDEWLKYGEDYDSWNWDSEMMQIYVDDLGKATVKSIENTAMMRSEFLRIRNDCRKMMGKISIDKRIGAGMYFSVNSSNFVRPGSRDVGNVGSPGAVKREWKESKEQTDRLINMWELMEIILWATPDEEGNPARPV